MSKTKEILIGAALVGSTLLTGCSPVKPTCVQKAPLRKPRAVATARIVQANRQPQVLSGWRGTVLGKDGRPVWVPIEHIKVLSAPVR